METLKIFSTNHPVLFVLGLPITWFVLLMVFTGLGSSLFRKPFGDTTTTMIGHLVVTVCLLLLVRRLDWLDAAGIGRLGKMQIWLLALAGVIYFTSVSFYAFYGKLSFDFSSLFQIPASRTVVMTNLIVAISEEFLFRGIMLFCLVRVWGDTRLGIVGSLLLISLIFALLHLTQVFTSEISGRSLSFLVFETFIIAIWWGALVISGGSIWPAVLLHFVVNAAVAIQGLMVPMVDPATHAYTRIFLFSIPLGFIGIMLLL